jgi:predicted nucleotidyltransferase
MSSFQHFIKEIIEQTKLVAIFGSYASQDQDSYSDIDFLILYDKDHTLTSIQKKIATLNNRIRRQIHLNAYQIDDFQKRLSYHDYKLLSMLNNAVVLQGEANHLLLSIREKRVNAVSIKYNENMGVKYLTAALQNLETMDNIFPPTIKSLSQMKSIQNLCVRNAYLALGYLLASRTMQSTDNDTVLIELLSGESPLLKTLLWADKWIKRSMNPNLNIITECVLQVRSEFIRSELQKPV